MSLLILNILPLSIPICLIFLIAIFYAYTLKKKINETLVLAVTTIILILFLTGLLNTQGSLLFGYLIIVSLSIFVFFFLAKKIKNYKAFISEISFFPYLFLFCILLLFSLFLNYGRMFIIWDEFSHWGTVLKNMYHMDAISTYPGTSGVFVPSYLPGISLFQYFWMRPFPEYTEFPAYIAINVLYFSSILPFVKKFNFKNLLFLPTALVVPLLMDNLFYSSLYVDCIIGLLLGIGFTYHLYYLKGNPLFRLAMLTSIIFLLNVIKDMGFIYALVLISIVFLDCLLFETKLLRNFTLQKNSLFIRIKKISPTIVALLFTASIAFLWKLNLKKFSPDLGDTTVTKGFQLIITSIKNLLNGKTSTYQLNVFEIFKDALLEKPIAFYHIPYSLLVVLVIATSIILTLFFKKEDLKRRRLIINYSFLAFGSFAIVVVLLITYLFVFSEYEAINLASFGRYFLSYFVGVFFSFLLFIILSPQKNLSKKKQKSFIKIAILASKVFILLSFLSVLIFYTRRSLQENILDARASVHSTRGAREPYKRISKLKHYIPEEKEKYVYVLTQGDNGYKKLVLIYNLIPTNMEWKKDYSVSLTQYYPELSDPWTVIITPEDWAIYILENYEYVYIYNYDENFENLYGRYFDEVEEDALYEVKVNENGEMTLLRMDK